METKLSWSTVVAIAGIVILEALAISKGIDGAMLGLAIAAIAGLGGYRLRVTKTKKESKDGD